jgi:hypothetical protein
VVVPRQHLVGRLYNKTAGRFEIYRFDRSNQSWSSTGTPIDSREARVTRYGTALHVVSHLKDTSANADQKIIYERFTYDSGSKTYTSATNGMTLTNRKVGGAVLDRDSLGRLDRAG